MLNYFDLRKGVQFILEDQPYEVLEFQQVKTAQRRPVAQTKIKNLISGKIIEKTFHQGEGFQEAEIERIEIKFLYVYRENFCFCEQKNPSQRFFFSEGQIGSGVKFLKPSQTLTGIIFQNKVINVEIPIKVQLKVIEAPPGLKGDRSQAGTKIIALETKSKINAPLFIKEGDVVELNTETGEYIRRIE